MSTHFLPYSRQAVSEDDIAQVVEVLRSDWLTTGPVVARFEEALARAVGAPHAVSLSSGTAALHAAMFALAIGPGDEVIVPAMTFAATANCVVYQGATPVFADVCPDTLLIDPADVESRITPRTRAIIAVDYAGQPCDYAALRNICQRHGLALVADAAHSLGAAERGVKVGALADLTTFSFHPVKTITTGEGGAVATNDPGLEGRMRQFRQHGVLRADERSEEPWFYEMVELGNNYRLSDLQCALGLSQLNRLESFIARRQELAARYDHDLPALPGIEPLAVRKGVQHAYHLYVVQIDPTKFGHDRAVVYRALRRQRIGAQVHYIPVHLHPYYQEKFGTGPGLCPVAEAAYRRILSLPLFPEMSGDNQRRVLNCLGRLSWSSCSLAGLGVHA